MARSIKKGPYIAHHLLKKVDAQNETERKTVIKIYQSAYLPVGYFLGCSFQPPVK